jgi:polyisoprenoid-binding protein YceI
MSTTAQPTATTLSQWRVDKAHTSVEFAVKHMMITTVRGRFTDVDGTVRADESDSTKSTIEVSIAAASLDTREPQRDAHLRSADFLDAEQFPSIAFRSTRIESLGKDRLRVTGELTIHGVSKSVVLDVTDEGHGKDPWGGERRGFSATTQVDRRDFGLNWNQALEFGGWLVGNEVKITLDIQLVRQD